MEKAALASALEMQRNQQEEAEKFRKMSEEQQRSLANLQQEVERLSIDLAKQRADHESVDTSLGYDKCRTASHSSIVSRDGQTDIFVRRFLASPQAGEGTLCRNK